MPCRCDLAHRPATPSRPVVAQPGQCRPRLATGTRGRAPANPSARELHVREMYGHVAGGCQVPLPGPPRGPRARGVGRRSPGPRAGRSAGKSMLSNAIFFSLRVCNNGPRSRRALCRRLRSGSGLQQRFVRPRGCLYAFSLNLPTVEKKKSIRR